MAGVVERLAAKLPSDVAVLKIDLGEHDVAEEYGVAGLPALQLFLDGEQAASIVGFRRVPALSEALRPYLAV